MNVSISGILRPVFPPSKEDLKVERKNWKKERKKLGYTKEEWNTSFCPDFDVPPIDVDLKAQYFRLPDGKIATFLTAQVENKELTFVEINNVSTSKVQIFGRVTSVDNKMRGIFEEEEVVFSKNETESNTSLSGDKQSYVKGLLLPPGLYRIIFVLRDSSDKKTGIKSLPLKVPSS